MARATQGLQIVLIISIMLNVVLGVTTYLYNKQAFEKTGLAKAEIDKAQKAATEKQEVETKYERARAIIGNREWDGDAIDKKFDEDSQLAGQAPAKAAEGGGDQKPAITMGYSQMIGQLCKTLDDRTSELTKVKKENANLQTTFHNREAAKDGAYATLNKGFNDQTKAVADLEANYKAQDQERAARESQTKDRFSKAGITLTEKASIAEAKTEAAQNALKEEKKKIEPIIKELRIHERQDPNPPSGEITWVSLPTKTVWINRGKADSLQRGIRFKVFAAESNNSAKAVEKGTVEVTRIVADHQAECRIVEDKFADPIQSNDIIFTAFWSPGQQKHFVVTGNMNLDGDGRNQVNTAIGLIKGFGGVVDCWLDEQGRRQGQVTPTSEYVVHGDAPTSPEAVKNNTEILRDVARNQLKVWSLADFKQQMNYQKSSSVERFGAGPTTGDAEKPVVAPKSKPAKAAASKANDSGGSGP